VCFVSGFGVYFSKKLEPGSYGSRRFTRIKGADERGLVLIKGALASGSGACFWASKDWIPGQASLPGMTRYIV
jgi:hypothetical protein